MTAFEPNDRAARVEAYLSSHLGCPVRFTCAVQLAKGMREAPWRLEVEADGGTRSYVLQVDPRSLAYEYQVLKAMERVPIPTPRALGLDEEGAALGVPCFFSEFIEGESLRGPVVAGESWATELYIESVCRLQAISAADLGDLAPKLKHDPITKFLDDARARLLDAGHPMAEPGYAALATRMPQLPADRFSNGDLWLDNFIVRDRGLAGVIDFALATFSDPVYEFLLSFFVTPELQGRGIEERYCCRIGVDPAALHWYHGLEIYDTLGWLAGTGESFAHHTQDSLERDLAAWMGS